VARGALDMLKELPVEYVKPSDLPRLVSSAGGCFCVRCAEFARHTNVGTIDVDTNLCKVCVLNSQRKSEASH
jgi:hypothetical protein